MRVTCPANLIFSPFYHPNIIGWAVQIIKLSPRVSKNNSISVFKNFQQPSIELVCLCAGPHRFLLFATHQQFLLALLYSCLVPYVPRTSSASSVSPLSSLLSTALQSPVRHFTESFSMPNTLSWSLDTILHSNVFVTKLSEITLSCAM